MPQHTNETVLGQPSGCSLWMCESDGSIPNWFCRDGTSAVNESLTHLLQPAMHTTVQPSTESTCCSCDLEHSTTLTQQHYHTSTYTDTPALPHSQTHCCNTGAVNASCWPASLPPLPAHTQAARHSTSTQRHYSDFPFPLTLFGWMRSVNTHQLVKRL